MSEDLSALLARIVVPSADGAAPSPWDDRLRPGAAVGRFRMLRELGRGGFGIVFEAEDEQLGRRVAFKALRARDPARDELLRREARVVAGLQHPNIVTLHDAGLAEGGWFLVLELLRGETLARRLARGHLAVRDAVQVAAGIATALRHAHAAGVLHRDLKPANVFLTADGGVKVLDFGLARVLGADGPRGGTPGYAAPEQRRGEPEDARTDLFALGVVLAEMATPPRGRGPRPGEDVASHELVRAPPPLRTMVARLAAEQPAALRELQALAEDLEPVRPRSHARSVEAALQLGRAEALAAEPLFGQACAAEYRKALEIDPTLAVAHYELAVWARRFGAATGEQRASADAALRHAANASPLQRLLIRALAAELDGRIEDATWLLREATERHPDDARPAYALADLLRHEDELELCLPWLRRTLALNPDHGWALGQLAEVLGALGRAPELARCLAAWERAPSPVTLHAVSIARGWLGDLGGAEDAARRASALGGGLVAQLDAIGARVMAGRSAEVEGEAAALAEPGSPVRRLGYYVRAAAAGYQGRHGDGIAVLDALLRDVPGADRDLHCRGVRVDYLLGGGDREAVRAEVEAIREIDAGAAARHAAGVAWIGETALARDLGAALRPGSVPARVLRAVLAFAGGAEDDGLAELETLAAEAPVSTWRIAPVWLLGDLAARAGREELARRAFERFEAMYLPRVMWRCWAHARALRQLGRER
ncbi:MAG TPA: protein kinase [Anaeromyxobacteraceae bacterium]|nr:protein kinase [Anaeromyxobacteraceae bacterium]